MARPQKIGLNYFPFDVDIFSDRKIKILISHFGSDGMAVYLYILCEIYRDQGYYLACDSDFWEIVSAELRMDIAKIDKILDFLMERTLLNRKLFLSEKVLTSRGIQLRYQRAKESAGKKTPIPVLQKFWLLNEQDTAEFIRVKDKNGALIFTETNKKKTISSENNGSSSEIYPQRKEKEKEMKEKENVVLPETERIIKLVREAFPAAPPSLEKNMAWFLQEGVPESVVRYAIMESQKSGKPYSYAAAIIKQRLFEKNWNVKKVKKSTASYDLEAFDRLGFQIPKLEP